MCFPFGSVSTLIEIIDGVWVVIQNTAVHISSLILMLVFSFIVSLFSTHYIFCKFIFRRICKRFYNTFLRFFFHIYDYHFINYKYLIYTFINVNICRWYDKCILINNKSILFPPRLPVMGRQRNFRQPHLCKELMR